jgi:hypothetical protein
MISKPWLLGASALALLAAMHLSDTAARDAAVRLFLTDPSGGIQRIVQHYGPGPSQCPSAGLEERRALGAALVTVETLATSRLEGQLRASIAYLAGLAHIPVEFSFGPGRIKPSAARSALRNAPLLVAGTDMDLSGLDLTNTLLHPCGALRVAVAITEDVARRFGPPDAALDRRLVRQIAAVYNGQKEEAASAEARLSAEIYLQLVYGIYQYFRFEHLREAKVDARDRAGQ